MSISKDVIEFYKNIERGKHDRYRSWEHCYQFFQSKPKEIDLACLHLAFYLASWGMYRGSSFLLQKDYKIHFGAVKIILNSDYDDLHGISLEDFSNENIALFMKLREEINAYYKDIKNQMPKYKNNRNTTDTLITKILLGTVGCVPAYDHFFIKGILTVKGISSARVNERNIEKLIDWCKDNSEELNIIRDQLKSETTYPIMKIVDMYFWDEGMKVSLEENKSKD